MKIIDKRKQAELVPLRDIEAGEGLEWNDNPYTRASAQSGNTFLIVNLDSGATLWLTGDTLVTPLNIEAVIR